MAFPNNCKISRPDETFGLTFHVGNNATTREAIEEFLIDQLLQADLAFSRREYNGTQYMRLEHIKIVRGQPADEVEVQSFRATLPECAQPSALRQAHEFFHDLGKMVMRNHAV